MTYGGGIVYHLHMPLCFLGTFTEYPFLEQYHFITFSGGDRDRKQIIRYSRELRGRNYPARSPTIPDEKTNVC